MNFRIELSYKSLMLLAVTMGIFSGVFYMLLGAITYLTTPAGIESSPSIWAYAPISIIIGNMLNFTVAYPFYKLYCSRKKGQPMSGKLKIEDA